MKTSAMIAAPPASSETGRGLPPSRPLPMARLVVSVNRINVDESRQIADLVRLSIPFVEVALGRKGIPYTIRLDR